MKPGAPEEEEPGPLMKPRERDNAAAEQPAGAQRLLDQLQDQGLVIGVSALALGDNVGDLELQVHLGTPAAAQAEALRVIAAESGGLAAAEGIPAVVFVAPRGSSPAHAALSLRRDDDGEAGDGVR
ncbi:MAG TPA: hypothetical protein VEX39_06640 [Thermoleophilaceae bacterium]|nr:hypothetical protein [Thermoleophilaceae bacterium]